MLHEFEVCQKKRDKKRTATDFSPSNSERKKQSVLPFTRNDKTTPIINQQQFDKKIVSFVVDGMYPLSIVENQKFKDLFSGNFKFYIYDA